MQLSREELRQLYSRGYFQGDEYVNYEEEAPAVRRNFRARLKFLRTHFPPHSRLFEIGAAYGYFLQDASGYFDVSGCDISSHAITHAVTKLKLDVVDTDYLEIPAPAIPHDIICMWDTIEHLAQPDAYVQKTFGDLRSGGLLAISTGDIGSLTARLRGKDWRLIHPPSHLHYFSAASITRLLGRIGYTDIQISHDSFWRSASSASAKVLGSRPATRRIHRILERTGLLSFYFPLNLGDLMTVMARKP